MNYLSRIIHIWYWDRTWAEKVFEDIIDVSPPECILAVRKGKFEMSAYFLDGSVLRMIPEEESMRARRSTETFIQYGTKLEFFERVIFSDMSYSPSASNNVCVGYYEWRHTCFSLLR